MLSERLNELRNAKRKGKSANFMQFAFRASLFIHQHPQGSELMDSRIVIYRIQLLFRNSRMEIAAAAPSPTADATCLTLSCLTSPAAKTPAILVSKARRSQFFLSNWLCARSCPVRMKPYLSVFTESFANSVLGFWPMKINAASGLISFFSPVTES